MQDAKAQYLRKTVIPVHGHCGTFEVYERVYAFGSVTSM